MKTLRLSAAACVGAVLACASIAPAANGYQSPDDIQQSAQRAIDWFETQQADDGGIGFFGGDWTMLALADAGVNAADMHTTTLEADSLQDFYFDQWANPANFGYGTSATDAGRALLVGPAGGMQVNKLGTRVVDNAVAQMATFFDGGQFGSKAQINDDMFAVLGLRERGDAATVAPTAADAIRAAQGDAAVGGGWTYTADPSLAPDVDMTGVGLASLCAAGAPIDDPAVVRALDYLETTQDDASGGFASDFFGVNADTTAWVVRGLRQCGIDPQGPRWTTASGRTPLDSLVGQQKADGAFRWQPSEAEDDPDNLYATQDAVSALTGDGFGSDAPARPAGYRSVDDRVPAG
jgi:hypothetical protein